MCEDALPILCSDDREEEEEEEDRVGEVEE